MIRKKTKIVCTIGPASWDSETLEKLAVAGMDVARLNFSHGTHEEKGAQIDRVREVAQKVGKNIAVMADMQGPKIRFGTIAGDVVTEGDRDNKKILHKGDILLLSTEPKEGELEIQYDLSPYMKQGERMLFNDGLVNSLVQEVNGKTIKVEVQNDGWISTKKSINVPDTVLPNASLTPKDIADAEYALQKGIDYLAISFVQNVQDLAIAKELIQKYDPKVKLIVKLEKPQAVDVLEDIVKNTDIVMVARGDLAVEIPAEKVPLVQKRIINFCRQYFKQVIVATQMLESMTENPTPTRAEVSDVANAVFDEVDAVMLSGESANGKYPIEAVTMMSNIITSVEQSSEYKRYIKINWENIAPQDLPVSGIVASAASLSYHIKAACIAVGTASGATAEMLISFRPTTDVVAVTHEQRTRNALSVVWGVDSVIVEPSEDTGKFWNDILESVKIQKGLQPGDKIVIVSGTTVGPSGSTDTIKVVTV